MQSLSGNELKDRITKAISNATCAEDGSPTSKQNMSNQKHDILSFELTQPILSQRVTTVTIKNEARTTKWQQMDTTKKTVKHANA